MLAYSADTLALLFCSSFVVKVLASVDTPAQVVGIARVCLPEVAVESDVSLVLAVLALALLVLSAPRDVNRLLLVLLHVWMAGPTSRSDTLHCWNAVRQVVLAVATFVAHCLTVMLLPDIFFEIQVCTAVNFALVSLSENTVHSIVVFFVLLPIFHL
jgi:hypothetical protein